jgi:hypothetical protein
MSTLQDRRDAVPRQRISTGDAASGSVLVTALAAGPGTWVVSSSDGRVGGTFANLKGAIALAQGVAASLSNVVVAVGTNPAGSQEPPFGRDMATSAARRLSPGFRPL